VLLGSKSATLVEIHNAGKKIRALKVRLLQSPGFSVLDDATGAPPHFPMTIAPGSKTRLQLHGTPRHVGSLHLSVIFDFASFWIGRRFELLVTDPTDAEDRETLQPTKPYEKKRRQRRRRPRGRDVVPPERGPSRPGPKLKSLPTYALPDFVSRAKAAELREHCLGESASPMAVPPLDRVVALDCEMVGVGARKLSRLARASMVNASGEVLCDLYVVPSLEQPVTDYRTAVSGIRARDLDPQLADHGKPVVTLAQARHEVGHTAPCPPPNHR
jgi:hypothetical protein